MGKVSVGRIDRKSSIEMEPLTLNFRQIDIAREAALYVLHTRSREEANQIFMEGLEAVETLGANAMFLMRKLGEYSDDDDDDDNDEYTSNSRSVKQETFKDVLTAPS